MLIFFKKIIKSLILNPIYYRYSNNYITPNKLLSKKLIKSAYSKFLIKNLIKNNIKLKKFKFIYIYLFTFIYELSANCWNLKSRIVIINKINKFNLTELIKKLNYLLPTGFPIKIAEKNNVLILNEEKVSYKIYKILLTNNYNNFIKNKNNIIYDCIIFYSHNFQLKIFKKKTKNQFRINVLNKRHLKKKFILIKELSTNLLSQSKFSKKKLFFFYL